MHRSRNILIDARYFSELLYPFVRRVVCFKEPKIVTKKNNCNFFLFLGTFLSFWGIFLLHIGYYKYLAVLPKYNA